MYVPFDNDNSVELWDDNEDTKPNVNWEGLTQSTVIFLRVKWTQVILTVSGLVTKSIAVIWRKLKITCFSDITGLD